MQTISTTASISETLRRLFVELQSTGELSPQIEVGPGFETATIDDLGLDSVGTITLLAAIDEQTGVVITEADLNPAMRVDDLVRIIEKRLAD